MIIFFKNLNATKMQALDQNKLLEQHRFLDKWKSANARGSLVANTAFGKTTVALLAIQEMNQNHPERITHVVVPTHALKNQWEEVILAWKLKNVTVWIINTYILEIRYTNLLVLDEIHRFGSNTFRQVFLKSRFNFILGLTATLERQDGMHSLIHMYAPVLRRISLSEALEKGYVSSFKVFNFGIELSRAESASYEYIQKQFETYFQIFDNDFNLVRRILANSNVRDQFGLIKGLTSSELFYQARQFSKFLHLRKTFLNEAPSKIQAVKQIWMTLNKKMIVFCETTAFADQIVEALGIVSFAYHNAVADKKKMKQQLEDFKTGSGSHQVVVAVKAIEEGLDVPDIEVVVIVSGNATKRQYIQRMGRSLRIRPGKTALIINTYLHGTKDEYWLRRRQEENSEKVQWINSVSEIDTDDDGQAQRSESYQHHDTDWNGSETDL